MKPEPDDTISVDVSTHFIEQQSNPEQERFVFGYTISIRNDGATPARLLTRHWIITDANGKVQEVHGKGVVGEQPYLRPGEAFSYTSGAILETAVGAMEGSYGMVDDGGNQFRAPIEPFTLAVPGALH